MYSLDPGDVLLGAVERIDQHEGIAGERWEARHLLGDHVDPRHQPRHRLDQQRLRALVGGGHRRGVGLGADVDRIASDGEDRLRGIGYRPGEPFDQCTIKHDGLPTLSAALRLGGCCGAVYQTRPSRWRPLSRARAARKYHSIAENSMSAPISTVPADVPSAAQPSVRPLFAGGPRPRGAVVLAGLPRPDQPRRRHRQWARGPGGIEGRGDQDLRPRPHQEERADGLRAVAVLPAGVRGGRLRRGPDRHRRCGKRRARLHRGRQGQARLGRTAGSAAQEPRQARAQHAGGRRPGDPARRRAHGRIRQAPPRR